MISVRLSSAQHRYLTLLGELPSDLRDVLNSQDGQDLTIAIETAERFSSMLTELLAERGFDADYELTEDGTMLEELIDAFSPGAHE
jgi:hypothetical protein